MMNDDEFFTSVVDQLRANRAGHKPVSRSVQGSPTGTSSPKNYPVDDLWVPVNVTMLNKFGQFQTVESLGCPYVVPGPGGLIHFNDGFAELKEKIWNSEKDPVALLSIDNIYIPGWINISGKKN